jgi:hypothetical protein
MTTPPVKAKPVPKPKPAAKKSAKARPAKKVTAKGKTPPPAVRAHKVKPALEGTVRIAGPDPSALVAEELPSRKVTIGGLERTLAAWWSEQRWNGQPPPATIASALVEALGPEASVEALLFGGDADECRSRENPPTAPTWTEGQRLADVYLENASILDAVAQVESRAVAEGWALERRDEGGGGERIDLYFRRPGACFVAGAFMSCLTTSKNQVTFSVQSHWDLTHEVRNAALRRHGIDMAPRLLALVKQALGSKEKWLPGGELFSLAARLVKEAGWQPDPLLDELVLRLQQKSFIANDGSREWLGLLDGERRDRFRAALLKKVKKIP